MTMWEPIQPSAGITPSERVLAQLCSKTFLRLWAYPNLYRDQRLSPTNSIGKEICDLLVVCGTHLIIFSDKSCAFPASGDLEKDWSRWYRRAIRRSAEQIAGAERWLRTYPDRTFLDEQCQRRFPLNLQPWDQLTVHRIVVALNAADRCRAEIGGTGSLLIDPDLVGDAHVTPTAKYYQPFAVGWIDPALGYIHVLDDVTLGIVLTALNTVTDFVDYLDKKEALIASGKLHWAPGEQDLLAVYLSNVNETGSHDFPKLQSAQRVAVEEQSWSTLCADPRYQAKYHADVDSLHWDSIIEDFSGHIFEATLLTDEPYEIQEYELALRVMARERRVARRILGRAIAEKIQSVPRGKIGVRYIVSFDQPGLGYVYLLYPLGESDDRDRNRERRKLYLFECCIVFGWKHQNLKQIIGIATETALGNPGRSHDLLYFSPGVWTPETERQAKEIQASRGLLIDGKATQRELHEEEYPKSPRALTQR